MSEYVPDPAAIIAERAIREAIARGDFDNLRGAGKPLDLADSDDPDWWIKRKLKRERLDMSLAAPTVIALRREWQRFPASLDDYRDERSVREALEDYNRRVLLDLLRPAIRSPVPVVAPKVDVEAMMERWRARREARRRDTRPPT